METNSTATNISLIDAVQTVYPNAYPMTFGHHDPDSAVVEWDDCVIVVTCVDGDNYDVGFYTATQWEDGEPTVLASFPHDVAGITAMLDDLTEIQPEGTDWEAWAPQWLSDHPDRITDV
jgi:ABC-type proline/glycine betaine transport system substrate-binding protein